MSIKIDVLAFSPHPDDADLGCGGLLCKMKACGYTTGIIDLTRGEMGSRGTPKIRKAEALRSAKILALDIRENLNMEDGRITANFESRLKIVKSIRKYRPSFIFSPYYEDKHPDHIACGILVRDAFLSVRLKKLEVGYPAHAPKRLFFYSCHLFVPPVISIDITPFFHQKMNALKAFESQFVSQKDMPEKITPVGIDDYLFHIESRMRHFGSQINVSYAEGFITELPLVGDKFLGL